MSSYGAFPDERREREALAALRVRARESGRRWPLLRDPAAVAVAVAVGDDRVLETIDTADLVSSVLRTRVLDRWVTVFLTEHPGGTVAEIGSGLSTRFERLDNGRAHWVHLDTAEVVALRERLFAASPRRTVVVGSAPDPAWVTAVAERPAPHLILMESEPFILAESHIRRLISAVAAHCPVAQIAAELPNQVEPGAELRGLALRQTASRTVARELACAPPRSWLTTPIGAAVRACVDTPRLNLLQCTDPDAEPVVFVPSIERIRRHRSSPRPDPTPSFRAARHARSRALLAARRASAARGDDLAATRQDDPACPRSPRSTPWTGI